MIPVRDDFKARLDASDGSTHVESEFVDIVAIRR